ncbi:MAG: hypothetical protein AB9869_05325 [Verrucomicrobiia bacterium]
MHAACAEELSAARNSSEETLQLRLGEWIGRYQAEAETLRGVVRETAFEHQLLILCKASKRQREFVDGYLRLVGTLPDEPVVSRWAEFALVCARECDREAEVLDALRHIARFSPRSDSVERLKAILNAWTGPARSTPEVGSKPDGSLRDSQVADDRR